MAGTEPTARELGRIRQVWSAAEKLPCSTTCNDFHRAAYQDVPNLLRWLGLAQAALRDVECKLAPKAGDTRVEQCDHGRIREAIAIIQAALPGGE